MTLALLAGCSSAGTGTVPAAPEVGIERPQAIHRPRNDRLLSWRDQLVRVEDERVVIGETSHSFDGRILGATVADVGLVVVHQAAEGPVATVLPDSGEPYRRNVQIGRDAAPIAGAGAYLWTVDVRKQLVNRNPLDGGIPRPAKLPRRDIPELAALDDGTAFAAQGHKLFRLDGTAMPTQVTWPSPVPITRMAVHDQTLWLLTLSGRLVALDVATSEVRSDQQLDGSGVALQPLEDGAVLVAIREKGNPRGRVTVEHWGSAGRVWRSEPLVQTGAASLVRAGSKIWLGEPGASHALSMTGQPAD